MAAAALSVLLLPGRSLKKTNLKDLIKIIIQILRFYFNPDKLNNPMSPHRLCSQINKYVGSW